MLISYIYFAYDAVLILYFLPFQISYPGPPVSCPTPFPTSIISSSFFTSYFYTALLFCLHFFSSFLSISFCILSLPSPSIPAFLFFFLALSLLYFLSSVSSPTSFFTPLASSSLVFSFLLFSSVVAYHLFSSLISSNSIFSLLFHFTGPECYGHRSSVRSRHPPPVMGKTLNRGTYAPQYSVRYTDSPSLIFTKSPKNFLSDIYVKTDKLYSH